MDLVNTPPITHEIQQKQHHYYNFPSSRFLFPVSAPLVKSSPYNLFINNVREKNIKKAIISQDQKNIEVITKDNHSYNLVLPEGYDYVNYLMSNNIELEIQNTHPKITTFDILFAISQVIIIRYLFNMMGIGSFKRAFKKSETNTSVKFKDIAGLDAIRSEFEDIIKFIKNPEIYNEIGANIPKGILLCGESGVGKTLLAKALANEANIPFYFCSGSELIEKYVGVGSMRLRELFEKASKTTPSIIFIDEIDAIGKQRSSDNNNGIMEYDQTLIQLLTLMDGFEENSGVIVIAATNRPDVLDSALLRPGRFDKKIYIDLPNKENRKQIIQLYCENKKVKDINYEKIAKNTVGFSGAELKNMINDAALIAIKDNQKEITMKHIDLALEKAILGDLKPSNTIITPEQEKIIAYHEAGHAIISILMNDYDILDKISIEPRGNAGGITYYTPQDKNTDLKLYTKNYLRNCINVALGGRIAEELVFGALQATTGSSNDFQTVMQIAYNMVADYGYSDIGPGSWENSEEVKKEIKKIINNCYRKSRILLKRNEKYLHKLANDLIKYKYLDQEGILKSVSGMSCNIKKIKFNKN